MRDRSPLVLWCSYLWFDAYPIANADGWRFTVWSCIWIHKANYFNVNVSDPVSASFLLPFNLRRNHLTIKFLHLNFKTLNNATYLKIQIVKAITIKLNHMSDITFTKIVVAATTSDMHSNGYMIANISSVIVAAGKVRLTQI